MNTGVLSKTVRFELTEDCIDSATLKVPVIDVQPVSKSLERKTYFFKGYSFRRYYFRVRMLTSWLIGVILKRHFIEIQISAPVSSRVDVA